MKKIEVTIGFKVVDDNNNIIGYEGSYTGNGFCYKDMNAFENGNDVIYISEYCFDEGEEFMSNEDAIKKECWTTETWKDWVREVVYSDKDIVLCTDDDTKEEMISYIAGAVLETCDWQDLSTYLEEWDLYDCIDDILDVIKNKKK